MPKLPEPQSEANEDLAFAQELAEVERSLMELKQRYTQVLQDQHRQAKLRDRRERIHQQPDYLSIPALKADLKQIEDQLEELEVSLESRLLTWSSFKEPFWQIVRFGGCGLLLGWGLAFATLRSPPTSPPPTSQISIP
jgi:hypothetical protein